MTEQRSAIGGTSKLGSQQQGNVTYSVMSEQVIQKLTDSPNAEFIVIQRTHQSHQPEVWSSGDQEQTRSLLSQVSQFFLSEAQRTPETTS